MGRAQAVDMLEMVEEDVALRWHLSSNLYPPVPDAYDLAAQAIAACAAGDIDRIIEDGDLMARAYKIVEVFHLEPFVEARQESTDGRV